MILARLSLDRAKRIADLGCGTGEDTVELARRSAAGAALGLDSSAAMIERATALRPYLGALPADRHADFIAELTRGLEHGYGTRGPLVFEFRRLFLWARRAAD